MHCVVEKMAIRVLTLTVAASEARICQKYAIFNKTLSLGVKYLL
jgi:hypothetical protein